MAVATLIPIGNGALAITHRPKLKDLPTLAAEGVTHLVTLLSEREGAKQLGAAATAAGLRWVWMPFPNGNVPDPAQDEALLASLREVRDLVVAGNKAVLHCSAGIHRTGMVAYAVLRQLGLDRETARARLRELRSVTADGVGEARLGWGDRLADAPKPA